MIFAEMPAWVDAPGNHPLAAAFPVPEVDVVPSSLKVETVTVVTTDHTISEGTEKSYSTAKTEGSSTSVANTKTWNEWQEVAESLEQQAPLVVSAGLQTNHATNEFGWGKRVLGGAKIVGGIATGLAGCSAGLSAVPTIIGTVPGIALCGGSIAGGLASISDGVNDFNSVDDAQDKV